MADEVDVEALLEAPFQKEKDKPTKVEENGKSEKKPDEAKSSKRSSEEGEDRDSKRRRRSDSPSREKERGRDRDKDRDRDRDRDRERDRDRRDRDRDRDRRRSRSRDRERRRSRSRERRRSRSKDRERDKEREWERERRIQREERDRREREMSAKDREAIEAERDQRTVFAINLPIKASERQLWDFFEKAGKVIDIRLISDRNSRKSKGFGYIEYVDKECIPRALALSGTPFMGQAVIVQVTQAEKNRVQAASASVATAASGPTRLYVGSLHFNITEDDLKSVFAPFGDIDFINLHMDPETGRSKGFGFVQFKRAEDAKRALQQVNGLEIAGRQIKVGLVNETQTPTIASSGSLGELDDDEGGGLALNAHSRAMLMAKLQRGAAGGPLPGLPLPVPGLPPLPGVLPPLLNPALLGQLPGVPSPLAAMINPAVQPSPCVLLKNMFDPKVEKDPDFHLDIKEDVHEECSKYGPVQHIFVDKDSQGHVYLKFASVEGAQKAISALNHRWFAGKMISAEFYPEATYYSKFPEAKS
jgi:RNA-binding protein 39